MPIPNDFPSHKRAGDQPPAGQEAERLTEQSLRSSQARLAGILDIADDAIISLDNQQRIFLFNQGAEKIFGYTAPEVLGQPIDLLLPRRFEHIHQQHLIEFAGSADTARRMGERRDIYGRRKDGTEFPAEASISKLDLDSQVTFTVILRDITARKRANQSLLDSQARLAGILDIADDAIISIDNRHQVILFNQGAEKIFGYTAPEVLGQSIDLLLPLRFHNTHHQHLAAFATSLSTARRMGERQDIYGLRKDGTEFPAEASISRLELAGQLTFTVILRDITTRKRFEQTLREQNLALERANQAKDRFLANMSHELRTPLNAVIGFTGTMLMRLPGPLTNAQERQLTIVQSSAKHLLALINDLLDLTKIESGKVELRLEPVALGEVIDEAAANLRPLAEGKGLQFEISASAPDLTIRTDRRALSQILLNLLNNAIKFTEHGQVHLQVVRGAEAGRMATIIRISDTGIGIRPEQQHHLFEAYVQGVDVGAQSREGTGLGLYLSQKLAALLGGVIEFRSEFGQGSTFTLVIPES